MFPTCPNKFTHKLMWNCIAQSSYLLTAHTFLSLWVKRSLSLCEDHAYVCSVSNQWWKNRIKGHAQSEHSSQHTPYSLKQIESSSICEVQVKQKFYKSWQYSVAVTSSCTVVTRYIYFSLLWRRIQEDANLNLLQPHVASETIWIRNVTRIVSNIILLI